MLHVRVIAPSGTITGRAAARRLTWASRTIGSPEKVSRASSVSSEIVQKSMSNQSSLDPGRPRFRWSLKLGIQPLRSA
ncbi:hypothetical protein MJO28_016768 [Puccinia striiformis f. sp. tritici]|nr:hypothetical protein MJO28_016768 [Puccinia striiformis f. sp. tritici]